MNYFVEGLQGSGKSTMVQKLYEKYPDYTALREGDYSPVELAWCAYVDEQQYQDILERYSPIRDLIIRKTVQEGFHKVICYTQILTDIPGFHKDLEKYEIYNGIISFEKFREIILSRYNAWYEDKQIFECSIFQNIIEDLILFREFSDDKIIHFYQEIKAELADKDYKIIYLETKDIRRNIEVIKKERSDNQGNELWFPIMCEYFNSTPYAKNHGLKNFGGLVTHLKHRQALELRICREVFPKHVTILKSKGYEDWQI